MSLVRRWDKQTVRTLLFTANLTQFSVLLLSYAKNADLSTKRCRIALCSASAARILVRGQHPPQRSASDGVTLALDDLHDLRDIFLADDFSVHQTDTDPEQLGINICQIRDVVGVLTVCIVLVQIVSLLGL